MPNTKRRLTFDTLDDTVDDEIQNQLFAATVAEPTNNREVRLQRFKRASTYTQQVKKVAQSHAARPISPHALSVRKSRSAMGINSPSQLSLGGMFNLSMCRGMSKIELLQKLHEVLIEKDRLNETMTSTMMQKVESEKAQIKMEIELGNLKEKVENLKDKERIQCMAQGSSNKEKRAMRAE